MAEITVANTESTIATALKNALAAATVSTVAVFNKTAIMSSEAEENQKSFTGHPLALVRYLRSEEFIFTDLRRGVLAFYMLTLADKKNTPAARSARGSYLVNAAKNAIFGTPPASAQDFSQDEELYRRMLFEEPDIDAESTVPWVIVRLPLRIAFVLTTRTSH